MGDDLVLLTSGAAFDVVSYPDIHSGPLEVVLGLLDCFIMSQMSGSRVVVDFFHALPFLFLGNRFTLDSGSGGDEPVWGYDGNSLIVVFSFVSIGRAR